MTLAMGEILAPGARSTPSTPDRVLEFLRDYREARPRILPDNYTAYRVEQGGHGAGTVFGYHFNSGRRERDYRLTVEEDGAGLAERDQLSSFVNRWTVVPNGSGAEVSVEASWRGAGGIGGFFERTFAPKVLQRIYGEMLDKLAAAVSA